MAKVVNILGLSAGIDLSYIASPINGIIDNSNGSDAVIPLADSINAGLLSPGDFDIIQGIDDSNVLHRTFDESWTGIKSSTNTGAVQTNGISLINNGTGTSSPLDITNNSGRGINILNTGTGIAGINIINTAVGGAVGIISTNNSNNGYGFLAENPGTDSTGFYSNNTGEGKGVYISNSGTGTGLFVSNRNNAIGIVSGATIGSTGSLYIGRGISGDDLFNVDILGNIYSTSFVKTGGLISQYLMADGSVSTLSVIGSGLIATTIVDGDTTHSPSGDAVFDALTLKENKSEKNVANGYAGLDPSGKILSAQLPNSVMEYKGVYNALTNTPTLINGTGDTGDVYRVSVAGPGVNSLNFIVGDYVVYNGTVWEKQHSGADNVVSVFGRAGVVSAVLNDYNTSLVPDTLNARYQTDNQKLYNDATSSIQTQLNSKANNSLLLNINGNSQDLSTNRNWRVAQGDTGVLTFTGLATNTATTINIGAVTGVIVNNESNPLIPTYTDINYPGVTGITVPTVGSGAESFVMLGAGNVISFQNTYPTSAERKAKIWLGKISHPAGAITLVVNEPDYITSPLSLTRDLYQKIVYINEGVYPYANGANLNINITGGKVGGNGINFVTDKTNPNDLTVNPSVVTSFIYRTQTGGVTPAVTLIDPTRYDVGGVPTLIEGGVNNSTLQYIYLVPGQGYVVLYGQTIYSTLLNAISAIGREPLIIYPNLIKNSILIGVIALSRVATQLNNFSQAQFFKADMFGQIIGATAGTTVGTLQTGYNNSLVPQIVTTPGLGALTIKQGSGADTDDILVGKNGAGVNTFSIDGNGLFTGSVKNYSAVAGSTTTDALNNLNVKIPNKTVEQFGTIGVGNDTAVIQLALNSLVSGDYLIFNSPSYSVSSDLTFTADNVIVDGKNCLITDMTLTTATITGSGSDNSIIRNFRFQGTETLVNWEAGNLAYRQASRTFVRFLNSNNVTIENLYGQGKRELARLQNCDDSFVSNCYQQGFFGDILVNNITDSEYARCVTDTQGKFNLIQGNTAYQTGAIVTLSQGGFHNINDNHGEQLHDNGIYNSSCTFTKATGNHVQWVKGSGIKMRSLGNTVEGNNIRHVGTGISVSGDNVTADSYNTNGRYNTVTNNTISDIFTGSAISINIQDALVCRDIRITNNYIYDHTPTDPTLPAVRILASKGVDFSHNTIHNSTADYGVLINGTATTILKNNIISNNQFFLVKEAIRMTYVEESVISNNIFKDVTVASIIGRYVNNSLFENNKSFDSVNGITLDPVYSCNNNRLYNNDQITGTNTALNTVISDSTESGTRALISQVITNGVTSKSPSEDAVFDALALKVNATSGVFTNNFSITGGLATNVLLGTGATASAGALVRSQVVGTDNGLSSPIVAVTTTISNSLWQLQNQVNLKADLASPTFTGDPKAPTPTAGDNDTSIATTAFVQNAKLIMPIRTISATTTALITDYTILCDATSGAITLNLPAASTVSGQVYSIKKINNTANNVTIDPNGAELVDFASTLVLTTYLQAVMIQSNGTSWYVIN